MQMAHIQAHIELLQQVVSILALVVCLLLLPSGSFYLRAQASDYRFHFASGKSVIDNAYMSNAVTLEQLNVLVSKVDVSSLESVVIETSVSPEGSDAFAGRISTQRAEALVSLVRRLFPGIRQDIITVNNFGENWDALRREVLADKTISEETRSSILRILDSYLTPAQKKSVLYAHPSWKQLWTKYYPSLRYASVHLSFRVQETPVIPDAPVTVEEEPEVNVLPALPELDLNIEIPEYKISLPRFGRLDASYRVKPVARRQKDATHNTGFAVKTNLLYDAVTALNVEVEAPIGSRFSVQVEDVFPWWEFSKNKYAFQMWEMGPEFRFWFKKWNPVGTEKLRGWFVGIYGMSARYDFQWDRDVNYQGEYWSAGVSGGYVLPFGKKKDWRMEFSLALGYLSTDYRHYLPTDLYDKLIRDPYKVGTLTYFGPTKLKVVLSMPVNFKVKKGGER